MFMVGRPSETTVAVGSILSGMDLRSHTLVLINQQQENSVGLLPENRDLQESPLKVMSPLASSAKSVSHFIVFFIVVSIISLPYTILVKENMLSFKKINLLVMCTGACL